MREAFLASSITLSALVLVLILVAFGYGFIRPDSAARLRRPPTIHHRYGPVRPDQVAILIASRNGAATIAGAVTAARTTGAPVYVISDGSTDATAQVAATT